MPKVKQSRRKNSSLGAIETITLKGRRTAAGIEAEYFKMSHSKWGIKIYSSFEEACEAYNAQKKAARFGLGPKVGKFLIIDRTNDGYDYHYFGYETQRAKKVEHRDAIWEKQCDRLEKKLIEKGIGGGDFCAPNCGAIDGKLVLVDFGRCSRY